MVRHHRPIVFKSAITTQTSYIVEPVCSIDWKLVVAALAALGSFLASFVALLIATRDRRDRAKERHEEAAAEARLVLFDITAPEMRPDPPWPYFKLAIHNFGPVSILKVSVESASLKNHPGSHWTIAGSGTPIEMVKPERESHAGGNLYVGFNDDAGESVVKAEKVPSTVIWSYPTAGADQVSATIRFMDAKANWWLKSSDGELKPG